MSVGLTSDIRHFFAIATPCVIRTRVQPVPSKCPIRREKSSVGFLGFFPHGILARKARRTRTLGESQNLLTSPLFLTPPPFHCLQIVRYTACSLEPHSPGPSPTHHQSFLRRNSSRTSAKRSLKEEIRDHRSQYESEIARAPRIRPTSRASTQQPGTSRAPFSSP